MGAFQSGAEAYRIADDSEYLAVGAVCSELVSGRKSLICWEDTGKYTEIGRPRRGCFRDLVAFRGSSRRVPQFREEGISH